MKSELELLQTLNKCVFADGDKIRLNHERLATLVPDKSEQSKIIQAINADPPLLVPYHDRFAIIEYHTIAHKKVEHHLAIVVDEDGKAVLLLHRDTNHVIWEREIVV